ncbi:hypothetical protein NDU88_001911 [Pleurodeles waltl]|uniref:Uncharacterized protein n=1 Tax=Pleurodeles waltl TaxID=8319 RepID=A0AAV7TK91_PLEWA|nr:hypothetical protein NDU88_001911 [Pleurodeles waltl]
MLGPPCHGMSAGAALHAYLTFIVRFVVRSNAHTKNTAATPPEAHGWCPHTDVIIVEVYLSDFAVNMTEEEDSQVFQENLKSFIKDSVQQAVAVSMSEVTKNLEASFSKIMTSSKVPVNKGKKRAATLPVPSKVVSSGPSTREVSKSGPPPSPVHVTHLRDTDDDDDDSSHTDDMDGSADPFLCGPLEKRRKISPSDGGAVHPVSHMLVDQAGEPLFDTSFMVHPNSKEWYPSDHVADYVSFFLRHPLDKATRNKLKSECPRPSLPNNITSTPVIDPNMLMFFTKFGKDPKKGVDRACFCIKKRGLVARS